MITRSKLNLCNTCKNNDTQPHKATGTDEHRQNRLPVLFTPEQCSHHNSCDPSSLYALCNHPVASSLLVSAQCCLNSSGAKSWLTGFHVIDVYSIVSLPTFPFICVASGVLFLHRSSLVFQQIHSDVASLLHNQSTSLFYIFALHVQHHSDLCQFWFFFQLRFRNYQHTIWFYVFIFLMRRRDL